MHKIIQAGINRKKQGSQFHIDLANYWDFLGLRGYKREHEYRGGCDWRDSRKLQRYLINTESLIPQPQIFEIIEVIPQQWYNQYREDIKADALDAAIKAGFDKWLRWEQDTQKFLTEQIDQCAAAKNYVLMAMFSDMLKDNQDEIKYIDRCMLELTAVNWSKDYIFQLQAPMHDMYREKMCEIGKI